MKKSLLASSVVLMAACSQAPKATLPTAQTSQLPTDDRPNILIIIADDMGFSDIGAFGSEIDTPISTNWLNRA